MQAFAALLIAATLLQQAFAAPNLPAFKTCLQQKKANMPVYYSDVAANAPTYSTYQTRNFNSRFDHKKPLAIALPSTPTHVSILLVCSSKAALPIAVRDGGHNYEALSLVNQGLVIDMSKFDKIQIDGPKKMVHIGGGQRLGPVYKHLYEKAKILLPGGTCASVGVSGLTLGGGLGANSRRLGTMSDQLVAAQVVLANGSIVTASSTQNPELYFALRGGGGNYGVVTQWSFKWIAAPTTVTVLEVNWPKDQFPEVMKAVAQWQPWKISAKYSKVEWFYGFGSVTLSIYYWGAKSDVETMMTTAPPFKVSGQWVKYFKQLSYKDFILKFTNLHDLPESKWTLDNLSTEAVIAAEYGPSASDPHKRSAFAASSAFFDQDLSNDAVLAVKAAVDSNWNSWAQSRALGGFITKMPQSATAFPHRASKWEMQIYVTGSSDADVKWVPTTKAALKPYSNGLQYLNYVDCSTPADKAWAMYFGPNAAKLKAIKAKFDPAGKFNAVTCS